MLATTTLGDSPFTLHEPLPAWLDAAWSTLRHATTRQPCRVCGAWQAGLICRTCMNHWLTPTPRCRRCAIDLPSASGHLDDTCQACEDQAPEFDRAVAAVDYIAPWSPLFAQLKFQGATALATPLGHLLAGAVKRRGARASLVLPIPLSAQRMTERGYNQSWLIAAAAARKLGLPARHDVLTRRVHTQRLMRMSADERQCQIRDAFGVSAPALASVEGQDIALVDDVMTTGATLNAASRVLLAAGARSVSAWVVGRTPAPR